MTETPEGWSPWTSPANDTRSIALDQPAAAATTALGPILPAVRDALSIAICEAQYAATEKPYREALDRLDGLEAEVTGKLARLRTVLLEGGQDAGSVRRRAIAILCDERGDLRG